MKQLMDVARNAKIFCHHCPSQGDHRYADFDFENMNYHPNCMVVLPPGGCATFSEFFLCSPALSMIFKGLLDSPRGLLSRLV